MTTNHNLSESSGRQHQSAQPTLFAEQKRIRLTKRQKIYDFFMANLCVRFATDDLHRWFGTAFRSRVSEICRDPESQIVIRNRHTVTNGKEPSVYWAERKA